MTTGRRYHKTQSGDGKCGHKVVMANVATVAASSRIAAERSPPMWSYAYLQSQSLMPRSKYISSKMQGTVIHWGDWQGPRCWGAPWCWQCWKGWPPSPSHMPSLSRLSQLRTGGHSCPLPTPTQASPNPREAPIFFGCAGFSLWGIGSSLWQVGFL